MSEKTRDFLLYFIVIGLIFNKVPTVIRNDALGGTIGDKLVFYPLFFGSIYIIYLLWRKKNFEDFYNDCKIFYQYIVVYVGFLVVSLAWGLIDYPYCDLILNSSISQSKWLSQADFLLANNGIFVDKTVLLKIYMLIKPIKVLFLGVFYTFISATVIFYLYQRDSKKVFSILLQGTLCAVCIILLYSVIELFYLGHVSVAGDILRTVNPCIHSIENDGTWWPPLLWEGQLRSVFAEPSYFGIYAAFAMPLLWYKLIETQMSLWKFFWGGTLIAFTFCLFLTKARTAVALFGGEVCLLFLALVYFRNKAFLKKFIIIIACSLIAFVFANLFIINIMALKTESVAEATVDKGAEIYISDNLKSIKGKDNRSNRSRYSVMEADLQVGLEHPLLGVGTGLRDAYVGEKLVAMDNKSDEMKRWIQAQKERGVMRAGIPVLGEYTSKFAETGVVGLLIYLFPAGYLIFLILKKIRRTSDIKIKEQAMFLLFSFLGTMAAGIGDNINITYCYWVLLGVGYAIYWPARVENE